MMKIIVQTYRIKSPKEGVWSASVSSKKIDTWDGGPVKMTDEANTPSFIEFTSDEVDRVTTISLTHTDVPDKKSDELADWWRKYYMNSLKKFVEQKRGDLYV